MAWEILAAEALKVTAQMYFAYLREQGKTEEQIKVEFAAIGDEALKYHPDNLVDV